jgi:hypothetical protein
MPFEYKNFRKTSYFIHERVLKSGKLGYTCKRESKGAIENIPEGYEIYENPNGQVFCRKIQKKLITDEEVSLVKRLVEEHCESPYLKVDIKKDIISIWEPDGVLGGITSSYSSKLRYVLLDKKNRIFSAERFCYLGSIDDWVELLEIGGEDLEDIVKQTIVHLEHESFYELS